MSSCARSYTYCGSCFENHCRCVERGVEYLSGCAGCNLIDVALVYTALIDTALIAPALGGHISRHNSYLI